MISRLPDPMPRAAAITRVSTASRLVEIAARTGTFALTTAIGSAFHAARGGRVAALSFAGRRLCRHLEVLGPTFVKLGQILSTRHDLLPSEFLWPLQRLQQRVAPLEFSVMQAALVQAYGARLPMLFASIDPIPIGTGAIAQVHRATTSDGRAVALKILKPLVRPLIEADVAIAKAIAALLSRLPMMRNMPVRDVIEELTAILHAQADFVREAECSRKFRRNFRYVDGVRFPELIDDLCNEGVIAMEVLDPLTRVDMPSVDSAERKRLALLALRALYLMIFDHGFVHADMHPGNVLRCANGQLAVLDAGLVAEIDEATRVDFVDFFFAIVNNQGTECADLLWRTALATPAPTARPAFEAAIVDFVACESAKRSGEFEVTGFVQRLLAIQRRHGVRASAQFINLVLAMTIYDGTCRNIYPGCDFQAEARGYLIAARYQMKAKRRALAG